MSSARRALRLRAEVEAEVPHTAMIMAAGLGKRMRPLTATMETGGGLVKAEPLIDCDPFLALNSDNLWIDGPADTIKLLASQWDGKKMDALLLLVPQARALGHRGMGDFHMDRAGRIRRRAKSHVAPFVFTGIQMVSKRLLREAPEGPFSTNILWDRAIEEGRAFGAVHQGLWFDVGTPQSIPMTEAALENV
jgi:MurNAc alpha-1-phosphate uridylyltransferase